MALSIFDQRDLAPSAESLAAALGKAQAHWDGLVRETKAMVPALVERWSFAGPKFGWSLRLHLRDKPLLHLTPQQGHFLLGVLLSAKAVAGAELSAAARAIVEDAPRYAEGIGVRTEVATASELRAALELAALKLAHAGSAKSRR